MLLMAWVCNHWNNIHVREGQFSKLVLEAVTKWRGSCLHSCSRALHRFVMDSTCFHYGTCTLYSCTTSFCCLTAFAMTTMEAYSSLPHAQFLQCTCIWDTELLSRSSWIALFASVPWTGAGCIPLCLYALGKGHTVAQWVWYVYIQYYWKNDCWVSGCVVLPEYRLGLVLFSALRQRFAPPTTPST